MIHRRKFFGETGVYLFANILNAMIPIMLLPILTRVLTPADYGTVAMFGIVISIFGALSGLSVHGAIGVRYFQLEKKQLAEYIGACVGVLMVSTTALLLIIAVFGGWFSNISGVPLDWLLVAVLLSGLQFLGSIRLSLWQASGEAMKYGSLQVSQSLLGGAASLVLILVVGMAWEGRVLAQSLAIIVFGIFALWSMSRDGFIRFSREWRAHATDALKFGGPLVPHVIGGVLLVVADRLIITRFLDVTQTGLYVVALQVGQVIGILTESFNKAYGPWLMKNLSKPTEIMNENIVKGTYVYFVLVFGLAVGLGFTAPIILRLLVGEQFRVVDELVMYIALGFAFGGCYYMVAGYIFFVNKTITLALITFISGVVNVFLMINLVECNGIIGAGQAFMVTQALSFFCTWMLASKLHPMPWFKPIRSGI